MKKIIFFFLFMTSIHASWKLKRDYGKASIFLSENNTRLTINYSSTSKRRKEIDSDLIHYVEAHKKKMLGMIGLSDWTLKNHHIEKRKGHVMVKMMGSYRDPRGEKVYFSEFHFYKEDGRLQLLLTHSNERKLKEVAKEETLSSFKGKYGF